MEVWVEVLNRSVVLPRRALTPARGALAVLEHLEGFRRQEERPAVRVAPRHLLEQLVRLRAPALDHEDHRQVGVGLQVPWERRDLTPVGGGRLLRPVEARQQVAAQIVRSLQPPDTELRRASLRLLDRPQRLFEPAGGPLDVGEQQQRRRLAVAALKGGPYVLLRGVEASLFERDPGEELVRFAGMGREGEAGMGCGRGSIANIADIAVLEMGEAQGEREIR